ncbi:gp16 family protein [Thiomicrorhabdus sp. Kp2]|uniref:gp16 family protein n=1 Tax=Thiomicrorhabdus sp. Kp2 TaxID=1123518 RepID=UPI000414E8EF|nr:regulatory protein GemA [Thiomicrorhabdus sp. Kp2]
MSRQSNLAKIHIAKKDLGMADDAYRAMLLDVAKVDSASKLDFHGQYAVLQRLKELGWKPTRGLKVGVTGRKSGKTYAQKKSQGDKIRALWIELHNLGIVKDKSEAALMAYIKRMTQGKFEAPQFCDQDTASRIIESLKQWKRRAQ